MKEITLNIKLSDNEYAEVAEYLRLLPTPVLLFGLRFAYKRFMAVSGGYLFPGRKSIIKRETHMITRIQARRRLKTWKSMIRMYREKGYSYPTISRIKKQLINLSAER
ncbi:MAG TPA: hypothetical protein VE504_04760 [Nitrososphaeraceae archaeon]|nr:hypothetical protein [Nitrososphaeraceae archaeon]